jgi:hypothetical protein
LVHKEIAELPRHEVPVLPGWPRRTRLTRRAEAFVRYNKDIVTDD